MLGGQLQRLRGDLDGAEQHDLVDLVCGQIEYGFAVALDGVSLIADTQARLFVHQIQCALQRCERRQRRAEIMIFSLIGLF